MNIVLQDKELKVIKIEKALCIVCLNNAQVYTNGFVFCKECYEWLGWNQYPEKLTKYGTNRTITDLNAYRNGIEI